MTTKRGHLSPKNYTLLKGDILRGEDGYTIECERICVLVDEKSGKKARIALVWVRDWQGQDPFAAGINTHFVAAELEVIGRIHRMRGDKMVTYVRNENGVYVEV